MYGAVQRHRTASNVTWLSAAVVFSILATAPPAAHARRRFSAFETNGVFGNVATLEGHPSSVVHSETLANLRYVAPVLVCGKPGRLCQDAADLGALCAELNGVVPDYCAETFPSMFGQLRTGKLGHSPSRDRALELCLLAEAKVPSFCRLDAERFHGCKIQRQVVALHDVYVDGGVSGKRDSGTIFDASGHTFPTDPYKNLHSLPKMKKDDALQLLARAEDSDVIELDSAVYAVNTYSGIFYHQWVEVLSWLLYTLPHAPAGPVLLKAGGTSIDAFLSEAVGHSKIAQCTSKQKKKGTCVPPVYTDPKVRLLELQDNQLYRVKRLHVHWAEFEPQAAPLLSATSKSGNCSWYQALPLAQLRLKVHEWIGADIGSASAPRTGKEQKTILVVHRNETSRRQISNHDDVVAGLTRAFPGHRVQQFVGSGHTIKESFRLFHDADLVVGPHGAALVFLQAMRPGSGVVELTFRDRRKNSHLTYDFFRLASNHLGLRYGLSICAGSYDSKLKADVACALLQSAARRDCR